MQVETLMNVDLLRHQQRWKDGLQELRTGFATLESQVWILLTEGFTSPENDDKHMKEHLTGTFVAASEHEHRVHLPGN